MKTLPTVLQNNARAGAPFIHVIDIFPRGADTWSQMRYADAAITVDGNAYTAGLIARIDEPKNIARIKRTGTVATRDSISITLNNRDGLHRLLQERPIEGRDIRVSLAMLPTQRVRNGGFEDYSSGFPYWTETTGGAGNSITSSTSSKSEGAKSCLVTTVSTPGAKIRSDAFKLRRGEPLALSFDALAVASGDQITARIIIDGRYWNDSTKALQVTTVGKTFSPSSSAFERFSVVAFDPDYFFSADEVNAQVEFQVETTSDSIYLDAVLAEPRPSSNAFHDHRYEMSASDLHPIYYGEVRDHEWDLETLRLRTKSIAHRRHRKIPIQLITNQVDADWVIPPDVMGKPFPMSYGNFAVDPESDVLLQSRDVLMMGRLVNTKQEVGNLILVCHDRPGIYFATGPGPKMYYYSEERKIYYRDADDASGSEWSALTSPPGHDIGSLTSPVASGRFPLRLFLRALKIQNESSSPNYSFSNPDNLLDYGSMTAASLSGSSMNGIAYFYVVIENIPFRGSYIIDCYAIAVLQCTESAGGAVSLNADLVRNGYQGTMQFGVVSSGQIFVGNCPWEDVYTGDGQRDYDYTIESPMKSVGFWDNSTEEVRLYVLAQMGSSATVNITIYELAIRLDIAIPLLEANFSAAWPGRKIDALGTSDTWGSRYTATALVESPSQLIEGIARHELGIAGTSINTGQFDTVHTARSSWKMAGQLVKLEDSIETFKKICASTGLLYSVDVNGKESLAALDYGSAAVTLRETDFSGRIRCGYTPRDDVINDYTFHYAWNPIIEEFTKTLYCNKDGQDLGDSSYATKCATAYAELGNEIHDEEFDLWWIRDDATAKLAAKWIVKWNYRRKRWVAGKLFLDQLGLEFGDRVGLILPRHLLEDETDPPPIFTLTKFVPKKAEGRLEVELLELLS